MSGGPGPEKRNGEKATAARADQGDIDQFRRDVRGTGEYLALSPSGVVSAGAGPQAHARAGLVACQPGRGAVHHAAGGGGRSRPVNATRAEKTGKKWSATLPYRDVARMGVSRDGD